MPWRQRHSAVAAINILPTAARWREALQAGKAPHVVLNTTNEAALLIVSLDDLKRHAVDLN